MLHIPTPSPDRITPLKTCIQAPVRDQAPIEAVQLARLAGAVLDKSPEDLMAIAETNPMLIWEWLEAFRERRHQAEQEARFWAAAEATLSTAIPMALRTAAE